ncbi:MAG: hypothetical protein IPM93_20180 [Candidatus Obscuribacter sp.]|nr:hypothetical protein [Candidatus Obscuribacter sp.]
MFHRLGQAEVVTFSLVADFLPSAQETSQPHAAADQLVAAAFSSVVAEANSEAGWSFGPPDLSVSASS